MTALELDATPDTSPAPPHGRPTAHRSPAGEAAPTLTAVPSDPASDLTDMFTICAEEVHVLERLIAAPTAGVFHSAPPDVVTAEGEIVHAGQVVGAIAVTDGTVEVTSAHTGFLMGLLALPGERVRADQPLAWVRVVA
jgi:biotin carboxyl carrier protein